MRGLAAALVLVLATATTAVAGEHEVVQKGKAFEPAEITIQAGDSIVFKNEDTVTHNMFSRTEGNEFNLKMQKPGEVKDPVTLNEKGTTTIRCAIHPKMKLTVNVE